MIKEVCRDITKCNVANIVTLRSIGALKFLWWVFVAEQYLGTTMACLSSLLEFLLKNKNYSLY